MFDFSLMGKLPWEDGVEPDAKNDIAEMYVERHCTDEIRTDNKTRRKIPSLSKTYVALCRFLADGDVNWIIQDETGVIYATKQIEALYTHMDIVKILHKKHCN